MELVFGCGLVLICYLASAGLSSLIGFSTYWPMVALWALWAANDAKRNQMAQYQRVFPLEPLPLFLAVCLLWPFALPWYLRLRELATMGYLLPATGPSRARHAIVIAAVTLPLLGLGVQQYLSSTPFMRHTNSLYDAVSTATSDTVNVVFTTSGKLRVSIINSSTPAEQPAAREGLARALAEAAVNIRTDTVDLTDVSVAFISRSDRGGATVSRVEDQFVWPAGDLRASRDR